MLRTLGGLTLALCVACSAAFAAEAKKPTGEGSGEHAGPRSGMGGMGGEAFTAEHGAGRTVMIEVLIADVRRGDAGKGDAGKGDAGDPAGDPKARIHQLDKAGKLDGLTRVQLTAIENQQASLHVGQRVPRITGSQRSPAGQTNSVTFENVGLMLRVTARADRDGRIVLHVQTERSQLGPAEEGTPISEPAEGEPIRIAAMETVTAETTVAARDGQSVLVGAQQLKRQGRQSEVLIVVTPRLAGGEAGGK
jgi:Flp pilus assembly secretin CpaC